MDAQSTVVISLPQEAQGLLAENSIDLIAQLRKDGLNISREPLPAGIPAPETGKEVLLTLVAIGITFPMIASGIARILDALGRNRKFLVTECELMPVLDGAGKPLKHAGGEPVMYWAEKQRLVEAVQVSEGKSTLSGEVRPTMLKFSVTSGK
jgi:hypothetical protein